MLDKEKDIIELPRTKICFSQSNLSECEDWGLLLIVADFTDRYRSFHVIVTGPRGRIARVSG